MPTVPANCAECRGILQFDREKDAAVCPRCGTLFFVSKNINSYNWAAGQNDFDICAGALIKYNGDDDVIIPDNVTHIGYGAFRNCIGL